ncbi:MAG: hypothetical protein V3R96_07110 [Dehalococcoidales bacterium]
MSNDILPVIEQVSSPKNARQEPVLTDSPRSIKSTNLTKNDMAVWTWMVSKGIVNALSGLSEMTGHKINVNSLDLRWLPAREAAVILGGNESPAIGIHLSVNGDANGHLLLMYDPGVAYKLIDLQLDLEPGSTQELGEMERFALEDIGNITGTYFLNTLADSANMVLMPSPPEVLIDTVEAIMSVPLGFILEKQESALIVKATFSADERRIDGTFMVLPTTDFITNILTSAKSSDNPVGKINLTTG